MDADPKTLEDLIQLNVTAPTLPRYFGQEMATQAVGPHRECLFDGRLHPRPLLQHLWSDQGLRSLPHRDHVRRARRHRRHGLCPGPTKTGWAKNAGKADSKIAKDPRRVAEEGFLDMQQGRLVIVPDADYRVFRLLVRPLPATF